MSDNVMNPLLQWVFDSLYPYI